MACFRCGSTSPAVDGHCVVCGAAQAPEAQTVADVSALTGLSPRTHDDATRIGPALPPSSADTVLRPPTRTTGPITAVKPPSSGGISGGGTTPAPTGIDGPLTVGQNFGSRYHIIRLLGIGGMGAVYQAWDRVLEVAVAVKVIRLPPLDPEAAEALERRFKRELLLARQVTHRNVVRIHDLGEIDGIKYITMPYIQGLDLATILRREGRMPVERALSITKQVAAGLAAAHDAGVVHRDLKPANIMVDAEGGALIMDFGIARSTSGAMTMTVGGAVVGTLEYMAPEQARGVAVDQRADIYSFGLIINDMLLGRRQVGAQTAVSELMERMQNAPPPVRSVDPTIPEWLDALVTKCVQPDPDARYPNLAALVADLELGEGGGRIVPSPGSSVTLPALPAAGRSKTRALTIAAALVLLLVLGGTVWALRDQLFSGRSSGTAATGPTISLAIIPFRNASGDKTLDSLGSSVSQVLGTELGQSSRVRTVPPDRLHQVLQDLHIEASATLSPQELGRIGDFTSARRVLWGQYARFGDAIRIDATLQDLDSGKAVPLNVMAANEVNLLDAITKLADAVRQDLARGSPDVLNELKATAWKPSTSSFEALRLYNEGIALTQQGTHQEALKRFEAATKQDPSFALAFSGLARANSTLGFDDEAAKFSRQAMSLSDTLPPQEKYLIAATHYGIVNDTKKAIESYENLVKASPNSAMIQFDLGGLYEQSGALDKAQERYEKVVELDAKFAEGLLALGRVKIRRGNPQGSLDHLQPALTLAIQLNHDEARANILQAIGIAYKLLNRPDEALKNYQESLAIKTRLANKRGMAASLGEIAQIQSRLGKQTEAEQSYKAALKLQREIGDKSGTSISLINLAVLYNETLGRPNDALPLLQEALQIRRDLGNQNGQAIVLNNIGNVYLAKGDYSEAQTYFERALDIREKTNVPGELADTLHNLAETLSKRGRYDEALQRYVRALELRRTAGDKRGAAIESYSIGTIFDYQASYGRAIKAKEEALQTARELKLRDMWLGEILGGYGYSLSLSGRLDEGGKSLDEAMTVARELNNPLVIAQTSRFQADRLYLLGDIAGAKTQADQAAQAAAAASDRSMDLLAQTRVAMVAAALQPTRALAQKFASLSQTAETLGLKSLSIECSLFRAETLLKIKDATSARQEADRALARAEPLGFRLLLAKAHYLRAEALRANRDPEAKKEYGQTLRLLDEVGREDGNQNILKRADLSAIHASCERESKGL
jgi:eukaryotic-like serine/threonine-protein kinase